MTKEEKVFEILESTDLNWTVEKEPLFRKGGEETKAYGVFRSDNGEQLNTCTANYSVYQNHVMITDLVEIIDGFVNEEDMLKDVKGGSVAKGKKTFVHFPTETLRVGDDTMENYITLLNSHDGHTGVAIGFSSKVVSCQNVFMRVYKSKTMQKIHHTKNMEVRIEMIKNHLIEAISEQVEFNKQLDSLVNKPIERKQKETVKRKLFGINRDEKFADLSTGKKNKIAEFDSILESELNSHGDDQWGLFNAVTYWNTHKVSDTDRNVYFGKGLKTNNEVLDYLLN